MKLTRRSFIQVTAGSGGFLAAGIPLALAKPARNAMAVRQAKSAGAPEGQWVSSACQGCTQWCAIQVFVQDGRAVRVRHDVDHLERHRDALLGEKDVDAARIRSAGVRVELHDERSAYSR